MNPGQPALRIMWAVNRSGIRGDKSGGVFRTGELSELYVRRDLVQCRPEQFLQRGIVFDVDDVHGDSVGCFNRHNHAAIGFVRQHHVQVHVTEHDPVFDFQPHRDLAGELDAVYVRAVYAAQILQPPPVHVMK
jgi:hypothetical protein